MKFLKSILPAHTIAGKLARGDSKGAASSAVNYVKSGEILTDFKNVSTGNFVGIGKKGLGGSVSSLLNKQPSPILTTTNLSGGISQASQAGATPSIYNAVNSKPLTSSSDESGSPSGSPDNNQMYYLIGAAAALFLLMKK